MPSFLGRLTGLSFQAELLIINCLGLVNSAWDWSSFKWSHQLEQIWSLSLSQDSFVYNKIGEHRIKSILSWVVIARILVPHIYTLTYVINIYPILTWSRPQLLLPWMLLSLFKDVILELIVLIIGLLFWYEEGFSASLLFEFVVVKVVPLILASYNWHSNMNLFKQLKRIDNLRRLRRSMLKRDSHRVRGSRMFDRVGESFDDSYSIVAIARRCASFPSLDEAHENYNYASRSLTTLLTLSTQESSDTQDSSSGITDDSGLTPAQRSMKILGITEEDILKARERVQRRSSRATFKYSVFVEKEEEKQDCAENAESMQECRLLMNVLKSELSEKNDVMDHLTTESQIKSKIERAKTFEPDGILKDKRGMTMKNAEPKIEQKERLIAGTEMVKEQKVKTPVASTKVEKKKSLSEDQKFSMKPCASFIRKRGIKTCSMRNGKNNKNDKHVCNLKERLNLKFPTGERALNSRKYWKLTTENCEDLSLVACSCRLKKSLVEGNDNDCSIIPDGAKTHSTKVPTYSILSNKDVLTLDSSRLQKNPVYRPAGKKAINKSQATEFSFVESDLHSSDPACLKNNPSLGDYSNKLDIIDFGEQTETDMARLNKTSGIEEIKSSNSISKTPHLHETSKIFNEELEAKLNSYVFAERMPWLNFPGIFCEDTGIPTFFKKSMKIFVRDHDKDPVKKPDLDYLHREISNKNWTVLTGKINRDIPGFLDKKDRINVSDKEEHGCAERQNLRTIGAETSSRDLTQERFNILEEDYSKKCPEKRLFTQGTQTKVDDREESNYKLRSGTRKNKSQDSSEMYTKKTKLFTRETQTEVVNRAGRITGNQRLQATNVDYLTETRAMIKNVRRNDSKHSLHTATINTSNKPLDNTRASKSKDHREHLDPRSNCPRKNLRCQKLQNDPLPLKMSNMKFEAGQQKERKRGSKSGLNNWGTVTLAEVARSSGYENQNLRGKPPVYPQKSQKTASTRTSIVEKENLRKLEGNNYSKHLERRTDKQSMYSFKSIKTRNLEESIEEREAREMRALRAYNEVTLMEDRREMQARKGSYNHQKNSSATVDSRDSVDSNFLQKRYEKQSYYENRSSNEFEVNRDNYSDRSISFMEKSTETVLRRRSNGGNINVNEAVLGAKENRRPFNYTNERHLGYRSTDRKNDLHRGVPINSFDGYNDGRMKQDALRNGAVDEVNTRKRYTKYSKQKKKVNEAQDSLISCKRTEGLQEGRKLGRSAAKENVRRGTSVECISTMQNDQTPENSQSDHHIRTTISAVNSKKSESVVPTEISLPTAQTTTSKISRVFPTRSSKRRNHNSLNTIELKEQLQACSSIQNLDESQDASFTDVKFVVDPLSISVCSSESMEIEENIQTSVRDRQNSQREETQEELQHSRDLNPQSMPLNLREITRNIDWTYHPQGITITNKNLWDLVAGNENSEESQQRDIVGSETISLLHEALFCRPEVIIRTFHNGHATTVDPDFGFQRTNRTLDEILNTVHLGPSLNEFVCQPDVEVDVYTEETPRIVNLQSGESNRDDLDQSALLLATNNAEDQSENSCNVCIVIVGDLPTDSETIADLDSVDLRETSGTNDDGPQRIVVSSNLAAPRLDSTHGVEFDWLDRAQMNFSISELMEVLRCFDVRDIENIRLCIEGEDETDVKTTLEEEQFLGDDNEALQMSKWEEKALRIIVEEPFLNNIQFPIVIKMADLLPEVATYSSGNARENYGSINRHSENNEEVDQSTENEGIIARKGKDNLESHVKYSIKNLMHQTRDSFESHESGASIDISSANSMLRSNLECKISSQEKSNTTSTISSQNIHSSKDDIFANPLNEAHIFPITATKSRVVPLDPIEACWNSLSGENLVGRPTNVRLVDDIEKCDEEEENTNIVVESNDGKPLSVIEILIFLNFIFFFWVQYVYRKFRPISMSKSTFTSRPYEVHSASTSTSRLFDDSIINEYEKIESAKNTEAHHNKSISSAIDIKENFTEFSRDQEMQSNIATNSVNSTLSKDHVDTVDNVMIISSVELQPQVSTLNTNIPHQSSTELDIGSLRNLQQDSRSSSLILQTHDETTLHESHLFTAIPTGSKGNYTPMSESKKLGLCSEPVSDVEIQRNFDDDSLDRSAGFAVVNVHTSEVGLERKGSHETFENGSPSRLILRAEEKKICLEEKLGGGSEIDDRKKAPMVERRGENDERESVEPRETSLCNETLRRMDSFDSTYTRGSTHSHDDLCGGDSKSSIMEEFPEDNLTNSAISSITARDSTHD